MVSEAAARRAFDACSVASHLNWFRVDSLADTIVLTYEKPKFADSPWPAAAAAFLPVEPPGRTPAGRPGRRRRAGRRPPGSPLTAQAQICGKLSGTFKSSAGDATGGCNFIKFLSWSPPTAHFQPQSKLTASTGTQSGWQPEPEAAV